MFLLRAVQALQILFNRNMQGGAVSRQLVVQPDSIALRPVPDRQSRGGNPDDSIHKSGRSRSLPKRFQKIRDGGVPRKSQLFP